MVYKIIVAGRLEFGRERTFGKVLEMYQFRVNNFYKFDLLFRDEVFDHENFYLNVPRLVKQSDLKSWDNTVKLLEYLAEFAIAGTMRLWKINETGPRKIEHIQIEPEADKAAVQSFLKGKRLEEEGKENEAMVALNKAIEKYERHALAYERRGLINYKFKNYQDAIYDLSKSIDLNPHNAEPFFGRAMVKLTLKDKEGAVADLGLAVKNSIPLQPIHNKARKMKAEMWLELGQPEKAEMDLRFLAMRKYSKNDPFAAHAKYFQFEYSKVLIGLGKFGDAIPVLEKAMTTKPGKEKIKESDLLCNYGLALQKSGKKGFKKNWKSAAEMGSKEAAHLLQTYKK